MAELSSSLAAVVALSGRARQVAMWAALALGEATVYLPAAAPGQEGTRPPGARVELYAGLRELVAELFHQRRPLILVMALGVAVRLVGGLLEDKRTDPPVVVMDEAARFVISLAGGHLGGANEITRRLAVALGSCPVVTTASDLYGLPALDVVIRSLGLADDPPGALKATVAALLDREAVGLFSPGGLEVLAEQLGGFPSLSFHPLEELAAQARRYERVAIVTSQTELDVPRPALFLRPRSIVAGVGCRRGVTAGEVREALAAALRAAGRSQFSLYRLHTIEAKLAEPGLQQAAQELGLPLVGFTLERLTAVLAQHPSLEQSARVEREVGVAGVCEPAGLAGEEEAELICPKGVYGRVTVALTEVKSWWSAWAPVGPN